MYQKAQENLGLTAQNRDLKKIYTYIAQAGIFTMHTKICRDKPASEKMEESKIPAVAPPAKKDPPWPEKSLWYVRNK